MKEWIDEEIDFYDFIWQEGVSAHGSCINGELMQDFATGGNQFEHMKRLILEKFPTREDAEKAFKTSQITK